VRMMEPLRALWAASAAGVFSAHSILRPTRALEFISVAMTDEMDMKWEMDEG